MEELTQKPESRITMSPASGILIAIGVLLLFSGLQMVFATLAYIIGNYISNGNFDGLILNSNILVEHGDEVAIGSIMAGLLATFLIIIICRNQTNNDFKAQLGLRLPSLRPTLIWSGVLFSFVFLLEVFTRVFEIASPDLLDDLRNNTKYHFLWFIAACLIAPIVEEIIFRGLLFDSIRRTRLGLHGAAVLTSLPFALAHLQYEWYFIIMIIPLGMILAYSRFYSRSLYVPIILHFMNNTLTFAFTYYELG